MSRARVTPSTREVTISLCPDGPMLVRGDLTILDGEGREIPKNRATVALCRCGKSALAPFCDGSHKLLRRPGQTLPD
jgi:CDGSH-type Zn-finger protein